MNYYGVTKKNDNELCHWKYIRKYKKNGKTIYVYDQATLDREVKEANDRTARLRSAANKYNSGYYFDKDHPDKIAAEKQQANYAYQRAKADGERALAKADQNRQNEKEYSKTMRARIDKGKQWLKEHGFNIR